MYNVALKLRIGLGANRAAKKFRKGLFWANLTSSNSTILRFWGPCNSTIFEYFRSSPLLSKSLITNRDLDWGDGQNGRGWPSTNFHRGPTNSTIFRIRKWTKNALKSDLLVFWGSKHQKNLRKSVIFVKIFRKCNFF